MRLLVVGADAAGMSGAMAVRRALPAAEVVAFERGPDASYSMCGIPAYLAGQVGHWRDLIARRVEEFARDRVEVRPGTEVVGIDPARRVLRVRGIGSGADTEESYDALLYAAGARSFVPDLPGVARWGAPVRTLEQARTLHAALDAGLRSAVVVGGGYIGIEVAEALVRRGVATTLIERSAHVLDKLDEDMAPLVEQAVRDFGVNLRLGEALLALEGEADGRCREAITDRGRHAAELAVLALGARAESALARDAGCPVGPSGGLVVDERMRTPVPGIWAAGDCVESAHLISGQPVNVHLGTHANKQGKVAGADIAAVLAGAEGGAARFPGVAGTAVTKVCDWEIGVTGVGEREARAAGMDVEVVRFEGSAKAGYLPDAGEVTVKLLAERASGRIVGAQIVGTGNVGKRIDVAATWCQLGVDVFTAQTLDLAYAPPFGGVWDLLQVGARKLAARLDPARAL